MPNLLKGKLKINKHKCAASAARRKLGGLKTLENINLIRVQRTEQRRAGTKDTARLIVRNQLVNRGKPHQTNPTKPS